MSKLTAAQMQERAVQLVIATAMEMCPWPKYREALAKALVGIAANEASKTPKAARLTTVELLQLALDRVVASKADV